MNRCKELYEGLNALAVFRGCSGIRWSRPYGNCWKRKGKERLPPTVRLPGNSYARGTVSLTGYLLTLALEDENVYMLARAEEGAIDPLLEEAVREELKVIEAAGKLDCETVRAGMDYAGFLPRWKTEGTDFTAVYFDRLTRDP